MGASAGDVGDGRVVAAWFEGYTVVLVRYIDIRETNINAVADVEAVGVFGGVC